jgi:hypothetical protein
MANRGERSQTAAKATQRLFAVRFLKLRMARIVGFFNKLSNFSKKKLFN